MTIKSYNRKKYAQAFFCLGNRIILLGAIISQMAIISSCTSKISNGERMAYDSIYSPLDTIPIGLKCERIGKDSIVSHQTKVKGQLLVKDANGKIVADEYFEQIVVTKVDTIKPETKSRFMQDASFSKIDNPPIDQSERMLLSELSQFFKDNDRLLETHYAISKYVKLQFRGLRTDDNRPHQTIKNIFDNLSTGHWKSVIPISCSYAINSNLVNEITIEVKYPDK